MADFTENTVLLYFAGEPAKQAFEAFIAPGDHIRHATPPPFKYPFFRGQFIIVVGLREICQPPADGGLNVTIYRKSTTHIF